MTDNQKAAPTDAPPSYATATGSSTASNTADSSYLRVPGARNGIPTQHRRSMEDEHRPLPEGWVRQWDQKEQHQFFVNTKATPPKSIWHHPYDDDDYLSTLTSEQREQIQEDERQRLLRIDDHTDDESSTKKSSKPISPQGTGSSSFPQELPPRSQAGSSHQKKGFGERFKEKVTGQTKEEREKERQAKAEQEREYYEAHQRFRQCLQQAQMTGQPQFFAKDRDGKEIYIEPPNTGYGGSGYGPYNNGYGYNPYQSGPYSNPNVRFIRPSYPYQRGYGYGGYGSPYGGGGLGMPLAGGLLGGMLLGGLLF